MFEQKVFRDSEHDLEASYVETIIFQPTHGRDPVCYVHAVFTDPEYREQGRASRLVKQAVKHARERGCYKVFLVCRPELEEWYKKIGLEKAGIHMQELLIK